MSAKKETCVNNVCTKNQKKTISRCLRERSEGLKCIIYLATNEGERDKVTLKVVTDSCVKSCMCNNDQTIHRDRDKGPHA